jgi:hypothetical protein
VTYKDLNQKYNKLMLDEALLSTDAELIKRLKFAKEIIDS